jgi:hypothetical protein
MTVATCLYCLVRAEAPPPLAAGPPGLPGCGPPRSLAVDSGLWLVVADAPLPEYGSEEIQSRLPDLSWVSDRALAHEAVVESCAGAGTVVPMKLFTLFTSDERALAHVREGRERLDRVLDRVAGCAEWGVQVRFVEARAREVLAGEMRQAGAPASGTSFLLRKKLEQDASRVLASRLRSEVDEVFAELSRGAAEALRREPVTPEAGARMLLDAAFLVRADRAAEFEGLVGGSAGRLQAQACEVTLTGPWPPYNFLEEAR